VAALNFATGSSFAETFGSSQLRLLLSSVITSVSESCVVITCNLLIRTGIAAHLRLSVSM
jgi:hypothetical protein